MNPTEWFDLIPSPKEKTEWPSDSQWCSRHWAPASILGANGTGAATELIDIFVNELVDPRCHGNEMAMNAQLLAMSPICCVLGDERMYELWGHWPSAQITGYLRQKYN